MHLPSEILLAIFINLNKTSLKSWRLVSKAWSASSIEFLFDRLFVSPQEDLKVFKAVSSRPHLSRYVKELVYDASGFLRELDFLYYTIALMAQSRRLEMPPDDGTFSIVSQWFVLMRRKKTYITEGRDSSKLDEMIFDLAGSSRELHPHRNAR